MEAKDDLTLFNRVQQVAIDQGWELIDYHTTDKLHLFDLRQRQETLTLFIRKGKILSVNQINSMLSKQ